jgi:Ca2+-binding RTX toxin-like protein
MQHPLRRLVLGAALAGATIAAAPAIASASSTCSFDPAYRQVVIMDGSGASELHVSVYGNRYIAYADGANAPTICWGKALATLDGTDQVYVQGPAVGAHDGVDIDESLGTFDGGFTKEATGKSEIEFDVLTTGGGKDSLSVHGTAGDDVMRVGSAGFVDFNGDGDADAYVEGGADAVALYGGAGNDLLDGRGWGQMGPATVPEYLYGGDNDDTLAPGRQHNYVYGQAGNDDMLLSANGYPDSFEGGDGFDRAFTDTFDIGGAEQRFDQNH